MGGFDYALVFIWDILSTRENKERHYDYSVPYKSPTMAGGLFTIERNYFYEIGSYDDGMDIWGVENVEMSVRVRTTIMVSFCRLVKHIVLKIEIIVV